MADRLKRRAAATTGKTGRLPRRTSLGAYLGGDEAAEAEYAYQRLQEAFARPLPLPMHDARFGYGSAGATHDEHLSEGDQEVGGVLRDYFAREQSRASKGARLGTTQASREPLDDQDASFLSDVARSGATGVRSGVEGLLGMPGDFNQMRGDAAGYVAENVFGATPETRKAVNEYVRKMYLPIPNLPHLPMAPTTEELHQATTSLVGESYQPQTTWGDYSRTFGEMLPNLVGGGGKLIPRLLKDVVLPGLASETAGQLVEGTFLEPYVRGAAQMLSPLASSGVRRTMMPSSRSRRPNVVVNSAADVERLAGGREAAPAAHRVTAANGDRLRNPASTVHKEYLPPHKPPRPFTADYPGVARADKHGRLLADIEGRPLAAKRVVGRRMVGGDDDALQPPEIDTAIKEVTGSRYKPVPESLLDSPGQYDLGDRSISVQNTLTPETAIRTATHELGHAMDHLANWIRCDPSKKIAGINPQEARDELRFLYNDLNNKPLNELRAQGRRVESWMHQDFQGKTPESVGYSPGFSADRELVAEGVRAYAFNPNYMKTVAPKAAALFRAYFNTNPGIRRFIQFNSLIGAALLGGGAGTVLDRRPRSEDQI